MLFSPERGRILSAKRGEGALLDLFDWAEPGDPAVLRRLRLARRAPARVVADQRARLLAVHLEAIAHRLLAVVVTLHQRLARDVVLALDFRRIEFHVVGPSRRRV